jgi:hypothetical protein
MPLADSCTQFRGRTLVVKPLYGWGWRCDDRPLGPEQFGPIDAAGIVRFCASDFLEWHDELRHLIGRVESQDDLFGSSWITCAVMQTGTFDFCERLCMRYDLSFGPLAPEGEWPLAGGSSRWEGYGVVAESEQIINEYFSRLTQGA